MALIAKPFDWTEGDPARITALLDRFVATPSFVAYPCPEATRRDLGAQLLTNPAHLVYEAWQDGASVGVLLLDRIVPKVDARFHFLFLDRHLVGKRKLLINFLGFCFRDLGFHRISMEVPDGHGLEKFIRRTLGFRYEGEGRSRHRDLHDNLSQRWVAGQGSRREGAHFDGNAWRDIMLLRLLASEWEARFGAASESVPGSEALASPLPT